MDEYADFGEVGRAALSMVEARRGVTLSATARSLIFDKVQTLPPHPDVRASLERLRDAGFRLATLTNSPPKTVQAQLANADLAGLFEQILSVDPVRKFKPAPETYHYAAEQFGVEPAKIRLVAAHDWDVAGAMRAGCAAAFVARPGMVLNPLFPRTRHCRDGPARGGGADCGERQARRQGLRSRLILSRTFSVFDGNLFRSP